MNINRKAVKTPRLRPVTDLIVGKNRSTITLQQERVLMSVTAYINPLGVVSGIRPVCHLRMSQHDYPKVFCTRQNLLIHRSKTL